MRPIPTRLYELTRFSPGAFVLKDWAQGGLSSETYLAFFERRAAHIAVRAGRIGKLLRDAQHRVERVERRLEHHGALFPAELA